MGRRLFLDQLVESLGGQGRPVDASRTSTIVSSIRAANRAVVLTVVGTEVPGDWGDSFCSFGVSTHGALIPSVQRLLAGRGLEHVIAIPLIGMGPPLAAVSTLEVTEESPTPPLAVAYDAKPSNGEDQGKASKGDTDAGSKGDGAVIGSWHGSIDLLRGRHHHWVLIEWVTFERDGGAGSRFLLACRIEQGEIVSEEFAVAIVCALFIDSSNTCCTSVGKAALPMPAIVKGPG
jgi:hypothetical protein